MKAITLWQPWASLVALKVKTIETRSWRAPASLIGERIAIHAAARTMDDAGLDLLDEADWPISVPEVPFGAVVASAVLTACVPMVGAHQDEHPYLLMGRSWRGPSGRDWDGLVLVTSESGFVIQREYTEQLPFGDFAPGRYAWLLDDIAPTTVACPVCLGTELLRWDMRELTREGVPCSTCDGAGSCEPVPAKGAQRVWNWEAS